MRRDPTGFIGSLGSAVIDEIQRAPELMLAIKIAVDMDKTPGRFLLTGSTNVMTLSAIGDTLPVALPLSNCCRWAIASQSPPGTKTCSTRLW